MDAKDADIISGVSNLNLKNAQLNVLSKPYLEFPLAIYTDKRIEKNPINGHYECLMVYAWPFKKTGRLGKKYTKSILKLSWLMWMWRMKHLIN